MNSYRGVCRLWIRVFQMTIHTRIESVEYPRLNLRQTLCQCFWPRRILDQVENPFSIWVLRNEVNFQVASHLIFIQFEFVDLNKLTWFKPGFFCIFAARNDRTTFFYGILKLSLTTRHFCTFTILRLANF